MGTAIIKEWISHERDYGCVLSRDNVRRFHMREIMDRCYAGLMGVVIIKEGFHMIMDRCYAGIMGAANKG